ncbi:hypothetical protein Mmc1_1113 [Magnetococcus marinus MC-1]|uniref:FecR protein domain-containing protein n=1 Tax=Magnetococcus marinus (strain ATCC BAA-1437 / JCM 17883 / MC-1) TaxID=156889 RepID=A0L6N7_MAGMM|nr:FecR domain-containing protein [Magnetococcus marinus]ABK43630.1 hypothetical protein Mmc1_1113 [Magnetococcus marinus MC-1]
MKPQVKTFGLNVMVLLALLLVWQPPLWAEPQSAATALLVTGEVQVSQTDQPMQPLKKGDTIYSGQTLVTAKDGYVQLRFRDGMLLSLYRNSRFAIDDYHFSGQENPTDRANFSLLGGAIHTLTGSIGKKVKKNYRVNTAMAMLGVRGTDYMASVGTELHVSVREGAVDVSNAAGTLLVHAGSNALVKNFSTMPRMTPMKLNLNQGHNTMQRRGDSNQQGAQDDHGEPEHAGQPGSAGANDSTAGANSGGPGNDGPGGSGPGAEPPPKLSGMMGAGSLGGMNLGGMAAGGMGGAGAPPPPQGMGLDPLHKILPPPPPPPPPPP